MSICQWRPCLLICRTRIGHALICHACFAEEAHRAGIGLAAHAQGSECLKLAKPGMYILGSQEKTIPGLKGLVLKTMS